MATPAINTSWFLHIQSQFERARPILFTGAGFSLGARNICGDPVPSAPTLRTMIWDLCFPGTAVEDGSSLQDLYEHALRRNRAKLGAVATSFRFGLTREDLLIASADFTNAALNAVAHLVGRHIVIEREGGFVWARHRRLAEIITDELAKQGQLKDVVIGLARLAAAKVTPAMRRSDRPWRMLIAFINHAFLLRTVGLEVARNLYGALEMNLSWDPHFWLQRGSLEVEVGDLNLAEHFLSTSRSFNPDDVFLQTEWAYLLFKKACDNPSAKDAEDMVKEATELFEALMNRSGDPYPYHLLGSQGISWARRGIKTSREKEIYLKRLISKIDEGCRKYPKEANLQSLLADLKKEYLGIALPGVKS